MRLVVLPLVFILIGGGLASCGSSSAMAPPSPLATELSYLPPGAPFVMSVVTHPNSPAARSERRIQAAFPEAAAVQSAARARLSQLGVDYNTEIRPLWGNPVLVSEYAIAGRSHTLFVWITNDRAALASLIDTLHLPPLRVYDGAALYAFSDVTLAVKGATVVAGTSSQDVIGALARHAHDAGISPATFDQALAGLPQDAPVRMFGDLAGVLSGAKASGAGRAPWVRALRGYAVTITAGSSAVTVDYRIDTTGATLTTSELPTATGTTAPSLAGSQPIQVGVRDPAQVLKFAEAAERVADPAKWAAFLSRQALVRRRTGVDLTSLLGQLTGNLMIDSNGRTTMGRVAIEDPQTVKRILAKLAIQPRDLFARPIRVSHAPGGFYIIKQPASPAIAVGIADGQLVVGNTSPGELRAFAAAPAAPLPDAHGAVAVRVALPDLLQLALKRTPSPLVKTVAAELGDITGWTAASPRGLRGEATLAIK